MEQAVLCKSCGERPAVSGPLCPRCAQVRLGLAAPTEEEAQRLGFVEPESADERLDLASSTGAPVFGTPRRMAQAAKVAGHRFFQVSLILSNTRRTVLGFLSGDKTFVTEDATDVPEVLEEIEDEGWRLEHVGYIFQPTESVSRDKFFSTGQVEAMGGMIVGTYLFRARGDPD